MANPISDPATQAALSRLMSGNFPQGRLDIPSQRANAFLSAMGVVSPSDTLRSAALRLAARYSPYQMVSSGMDKNAALDSLDQPAFTVPVR